MEMEIQVEFFWIVTL